MRIPSARGLVGHRATREIRSKACSRCALVVALLFGLLTGFDWAGRGESLARTFDAVSETEQVRALQTLSSARTEPVRDLLLRALESDTVAVRVAAAGASARVRLASATPLLVAQLRQPEPALRLAAARALGRLGGGRSLSGLKRALSDADAAVRVAAIDALVALGQPAAFDALVTLLRDPDQQIRRRAAIALGSLGDVRSVAALSVSAQDEDPAVALAAVRALGRVGGDQALPTLLHLCQADDPEIRIAALQGLGQLATPEALPVFREAVEAAQGTQPSQPGPAAVDGRAARTAVLALGRIPGEDALTVVAAALTQPALEELAQAVLVQAARDGRHGPVVAQLTAQLDLPSASDATRVAIARTLAEIGQHRSIAKAAPALIALWQRTQAPAVGRALGRTGALEARLPMLEALGRLPEPALPSHLAALEPLLTLHPTTTAADPLLELLPQAKAARVQVVRLLGLTGAARTVPPLAALLDDAERPVRLAAIAALGRLGFPAANRALLKRLVAAARDHDYDHGEERQALALALGQTATAKTVLNLLADVVRADAAGGRDRPGVLARLLALRAAVPRLALAKSLPRELENALLTRIGPLLTAPGQRRAAAALEVLAAWHPPQALPHVAAMLRHPRAGRRRRAALALRWFPAHEVRPVMHHLLKTASPDTRVATLGALAELGDQRDMKAITAALARGRWPVPGAAMYSLARMAERGVLRPFAGRRALCRLASQRDPLVRANWAAALSHLGDPEAKGCAAELGAGAAPAGDPGGSAKGGQARSPGMTAGAAMYRVARPTGAPTSDTVTVVDPSGAPLPDRMVALMADDGSIQLATTDANGRLLLAARPNGVSRVMDPAGYRVAKRAHTAPSELGGAGRREPASPPAPSPPTPEVTPEPDGAGPGA